MRKEDCPGCRALVDELGRYNPGFCGLRCEVRVARDEWIAGRRPVGKAREVTVPPPFKAKPLAEPKQQAADVECLVEGCRRVGWKEGRCLPHHERHLKYAAVP